MRNVFRAVLAMVCAAAAFAADAYVLQSEQVGSYRWYYYVANGKAILDSPVDGQGYCLSCAQPNSEGVTLTVPDTLGGYPVVSAQIGAFNTCRAAKIVMPSQMTSLGYHALLWLPNITELDLSKTQIVELQYRELCLQNWKTTIIRTPKTLRSIAYGASDTDSNYEFHVPSLDDWLPVQFGNGGEKSYYSGTQRITVYVDGAPVADLSSAKTATEIGDGALSRQYALLSAVIPPTVTNVGQRAFESCTKMTNAVFSTPAAVGKYAFSGCSRLGTVEFPDGMKSLGDYAFQKCSSLTSVRLPAGLSSVPNSLFSGCTALASVSIPESVTSIGGSAFNGCVALSEIALPSGLKTVGASAFAGCTNLTSVTMPANVTRVGGTLFSRDVNLREVRWLGSCPQLTSGTNLFPGAHAELVSVVPADETWIPHLGRGEWCGRRIRAEGGPWQVTFDVAGRGERTGGGALVQTVPSEGSAVPPTVVSTDEDYEFAGWDRSCDYFGYDATVTAVYRAKPIQRKSSETIALVRFATNEVQLAAFGGVKPYTWALSPETPLPDGYALTADGVVVSSKTAAFLGDVAFQAIVTDSVGSTNALSFVLAVSENSDAKPVVAGRTPAHTDPLASEVTARTFSVTANDPEGGALNYRWFVDGEERQSGPSPSFAYVAPTDGVAAHALVCQVEDEVWKGVWTTSVAWNVRTLSAPSTDPPSGTVFASGSGEVAVTSSVAGVTIYVARGGSAPHPVEAFRYTGPLTLTKSETLVFQAVGDGVASAYGTAKFVCATPEYASAVGADASVTFGTDGDATWTAVEDPTAPEGTTSLRSGAIGCEQVSSLTASFSGAGTFAFRWKVDCEEDPGGACSWDALLVYVDDEPTPRAAIDGTTDWADVAIGFDSSGNHSVTWVFAKDDYDDEPIPYADCGWIDDVRWTSGEPFPELSAGAGADAIAAVFADAADGPRLAAHLTTVEKYGRFRAWALKLADAGGPDVKAVKAHPRAWPSFALGLDRLLEREPADGDLAVRTFAPSGEPGRFALTVSVGEWSVGADATAEDLAALILVEGTSSLGTQAFSAQSVDVAFGAPSEGKLTLTAGPADVSDPAFFMRLRVKAD